ncbi:hypothetical protein F444_20627 [Phytophthora nicotianae P1976]|uniref:Uncharacterized protein n=1 Tax=Phytophthora nicotianae P1976 TaxID=1317066 RepID=A0A080Z3Z1_PHYNI|nr:hypothetical protein F444_20627 [Phytophthora nicotianae P1976]
MHNQTLPNGKSTAEAEKCCSIWRNVLIEDFSHVTTTSSTTNQYQTVFMMATTHSRSTRPNELRWHYVRDQVAKKMVNLWKVKTNTSPSGMIDEGTR